MKLTLSALLIAAAGLATRVFAADFVAEADDKIVVISVPNGAYYAAAPGGCAVKMSDAGQASLFDPSTATANGQIEEGGSNSAHVFQTYLRTDDPTRSWMIGVANALPYDWATSYLYFRDSNNGYTLHKTRRVMPGGTFPCTCDSGHCKDDPQFGTNSVVATYTKEAIFVTPGA